VDYDCKTNAQLYARAAIVEFWVANFPDRQIEIFRDPTPEGYRTRQILKRGDEIHPLAFPDVVIQVNEILRGV
jgi:Uma2 family endonuclease